MPWIRSFSVVALSCSAFEIDFEQARLQRLRRARWREHAEPVQQLVSGKRRRTLAQRGHVGQLRHPLARRDGDRAQPSILNQGQRRAEAGKAHRHRADRHVGHGRRRSAIGNMQDVGAGHAVHQLAGEMLRVADARRGEGELSLVGQRVGDQLRRCPDRRGRRHDHHAGHDAGERHRRQLLLRIVGHPLLIDVLIDGDLAGRRDQQRVTVGGRTGDRLRRDHRRSTRLVFDEHRLAERRLHRVGEQPGDDVDAAAGRIADDEADVLRSKGALGAGAASAGEENGSGRHRESASREHVVILRASGEGCGTGIGRGSSNPTLPRTEKGVNRPGARSRGKRRPLCDCNIYQFVVCHGRNFGPPGSGRSSHHR